MEITAISRINVEGNCSRQSEFGKHREALCFHCFTAEASVSCVPWQVAESADSCRGEV
jgi:hypothetical protein